jgi:hypothetical protein
MNFSLSHSLPRPSTSGASLAVVGALRGLPAAWVFSLDFVDAHGVAWVFSLYFLDARGVELLPNSKSSSASSRVDAHVLFLPVLSGVAILGSTDWGTGGGDDGAARTKRLLTREASGMLTWGGGVTMGRGWTSGRLW